MERRRHYEDAARSQPSRPDSESSGADCSDPHYARNRDYAPPRSGDYSSARPSGAWRGDQDRTTTPEQRARGFEPRDRDVEQGRDDEQPYYRGYYNRPFTPYANPVEQGTLYAESWTITGPHTGRGPKGYKRSDQQIVDEASQRLERAGHIDATDIEVTAEDGVITLRGTVQDRATKRRAEECVESVYGARDVMNMLRVPATSAAATAGSERASSQSSQASQGPQSMRSQADNRQKGTSGRQRH
jgi:hypothetical protein